MNLGLKGKSVVVTGGTRGIGRAIVRAFTAEGAHVAFCARDAAMVDSYADELRGDGAKVLGQAIDVTKPSQLEAFVANAAQAHNGIDVVVPNVSALAMPMDESAWRAGFETDILGTVNTVDAAMPHLEKSPAAAIVVIASTAALEIYSGARAYNSIKSALVAYVSGMSVSFGPKGIRANTVSPGAVYFDGGVWQQIERDDPPKFKDMLDGVPLRRMARPEDIASAVVYVASPAAGYMSGANLVVDGGMTRRIQY